MFLHSSPAILPICVNATFFSLKAALLVYIYLKKAVSGVFGLSGSFSLKKLKPFFLGKFITPVASIFLAYVAVGSLYPPFYCASSFTSLV